MTGWQSGPRRDWLHCPLHNISHDTNIVPQMEITWKHKNKLKSWQRSWGVHYSILIRAVFCLGSNVYGIATTAWGGIKSLVFNNILNIRSGWKLCIWGSRSNNEISGRDGLLRAVKKKPKLLRRVQWVYCVLWSLYCALYSRAGRYKCQ